ncbi:peptide-methionine (S)-S-oxide reductase MsrA [Sphingomonas sp. NSE70-1]|uniref:Peptide methionine sulfoxide reductase MsrA n=1 Tax=Sphingomonas caseinilyticus TaxID=2908205 RepID=A0ABT0RWF1_9SPHN|nr:peptide-methionine (S)-S-oxide reductase MsrA [Sphingomonas caseinilyticus]MCL6699224.1 peptide-methionine (S)-S-oxide reductase MsrA [Sphingomonas caseinilyticus]
MAMKQRIAIGLAAATAAIALPTLASLSGKAEAAAVPPPQLNERATGNREVAVLAGGCFWGVEAVYEHVKGVSDVRSGFAGGDRKSATYDKVSGGGTRHAEAVRIVYDPKVIGYGDLLRIFFAVVHDPTEVNRQGPDVGPQYRSAIFPQSEGQARVARAYIAQLSKQHIFPKPIATKLEQGAFVAAEAYHQDFMRKNPTHPYIVYHDKPKVAALKRQFPLSWKG